MAPTLFQVDDLAKAAEREILSAKATP